MPGGACGAWASHVPSPCRTWIQLVEVRKLAKQGRSYITLCESWMLLAWLGDQARTGWCKGLDTSHCHASLVHVDPAQVDRGTWWCFTEELGETLLFFWLGVWRRDGDLPQIWDTVTEVRHSPSPCAVNRRAVPIQRGEWSVRLCAALALGKSCTRNLSCFWDKGTLYLHFAAGTFSWWNLRVNMYVQFGWSLPCGPLLTSIGCTRMRRW